MRAICLNRTLKRSPEDSNTHGLADVVTSALRDQGVETDEIRLVDHRIVLGVVSDAIDATDEWPAIRARILAAEIRVAATPTWLGHEVNGALDDIGFTLPGQNRTYWDKGLGPGDEEWLTTSEQEWSTSTGRTAAQSLLAAARALQAAPIPAPAG